MGTDRLTIPLAEPGRVPEAERRALAEAVSRDGYAVAEVRPPGRDTRDPDPLVVLADALGRRQLHPRGDRFGIIGTVTGGDGREGHELSPAWRDHVDEYQAVGPKDVGCHTDGAFIDGPGVAPPALLLLHCARPADAGGESVLVDGATLFDTVRQADPRLLRELMREQFTFCRDELVAVNQPVFRRRGRTAVGVRWRFDKAVYGTRGALRAARAFHDGYVRTAPRTEIPLRRGEILVIDNLRMLHARKESRGQRVLRRAWIVDAACEPVANLVDRSAHPQAYQAFAFYQPLPRGPGREPAALSLGVKVAVDGGLIPCRADHAS
ncbi:TauD/TfdA family dioxygenase [Streptomyces gamaensis]|uniref:TauD/TfdA family dioxygenase n=1 Tax=Streptomyces gamaensis TaxID=1763542 RepID=A0ABW0YZJ4_9ACTN